MSSSPDAGHVTLDQDAALAAAAERLAREFDGAFDPETIAQVLRDAHQRLAPRATVSTFVPLLSERFARQQLRALERIEGTTPDTGPTVLFLCVHNAGRSQMALGFLEHFAAGRAVGWSGGSEPGHEVNPVAVRAMAELGIDISGEYPKPWTNEAVQAADVVVTMGCGDTCPYYPGTRYEDWELADPAGQGIEDVRPVRDEIRDRVLALLASLGVTAPSDQG